MNLSLSLCLWESSRPISGAPYSEIWSWKRYYKTSCPLGGTRARWNCLAVSSSLIGHFTQFASSPWKTKSMDWQSWPGDKWGPSFHFLSGRLYLPWQGQYIIYVNCSQPWYKPHLYLWPKWKELGSNLFILNRLHFLTSRNAQHLALKFSSKPEQGQAPSDPTKCSPLANTHLTPVEQNQL